MPTNHSTSSAMFRTSLASLTSGPPQRASIPVLALEAQPPTGLPSRPTCRGAGPLQVLTTRGFAGDSRQASPVRPVYNADQPITALKGTGIRTLGPPYKGVGLSRGGTGLPHLASTIDAGPRSQGLLS